MGRSGADGWRSSGSRDAILGADTDPIRCRDDDVERQVNNDNKNFIVFAVIAALILFGWPLAQSRFFPTANPPATKIVDGKSKALPQPGADPTADGPAAIRDRRVVRCQRRGRRRQERGPVNVSFRNSRKGFPSNWAGLGYWARRTARHLCGLNRPHCACALRGETNALR